MKFDDNCLGGYCDEDKSKLQVFNNGQKINNDFRNLILQQHQEIVIIFGTQQQTPTIHTNYNFPAGY